MSGRSKSIPPALLAIMLVGLSVGLAPAQVGEGWSESSVIRLDVEQGQDLSGVRGLTVEVGDSTRPQFDPSFRLSAWQGEAIFRVGLASTSQPLTSAIRQVSVRNGQPLTRLATDEYEHELFVRADGGFEWNLILIEPPKDSVFCYALDLDGVRVFRQRWLTADEIANGAVRPDSVVGSYAVYHATGRGNVRHNNDYVSRYRCGKAFHIYRPRAWDAAGDTVWVDLLVDTAVDSLSLSLSGRWLSRAVYPVTVDPTFGTTSMGASSQGVGSTDVLHCRYTMSSHTGILDSITWGLNRTGGQPKVGYAMYEKKPNFDACSLLVDTSLNQYAPPFGLMGTWYGLEMSEDASLAANADYWLSLGVEDASCDAWYDDTDADTTAGHQDDPWPFDNPCNTGWLVYASNRTYSVYGTFTCDDCATSGRRRRHLQQ